MIRCSKRNHIPTKAPCRIYIKKLPAFGRKVVYKVNNVARAGRKVVYKVNNVARTGKRLVQFSHPDG